MKIIKADLDGKEVNSLNIRSEIWRRSLSLQSLHTHKSFEKKSFTHTEQ